MNLEWIRKNFKVEPTDVNALANPEEYILKNGGRILIALLRGKPVGCCALIQMEMKGSFELAKMAVAPRVRGRNIGWILGNAIIQAAKSIGAKRIYLESNTELKAAVNLYYKLGFKRIDGPPSPYERCNIQMELIL